MDDIIASAPDSNGISWTRTQGEKLARFISNDRRRNSDALANGLLHGSLSVVEAISMADSQMEKICGTFDAVQLHHAALRDAVQEEESAAEQWNRATTDERALQRYGEAALDVTRRQWARRGIDWCAHTAREHFHGDGGTRRARKFAARAHFEATGERLPRLPNGSGVIGLPPKHRAKTDGVPAFLAHFYLQARFECVRRKLMRVRDDTGAPRVPLETNESLAKWDAWCNHVDHNDVKDPKMLAPYADSLEGVFRPHGGGKGPPRLMRRPSERSGSSWTWAMSR